MLYLYGQPILKLLAKLQKKCEVVSINCCLNPIAGGVQANTVGDDRLPVPSGLDGLQLPNLEGMLGSMQDPTLANRLLQNPGISHMMQSLLSDPQYMNQVAAINPQLRSILDSNPHLREMMQNPEFLRQLTSPETMQGIRSDWWRLRSPKYGT